MLERLGRHRGATALAADRVASSHDSHVESAVRNWPRVIATVGCPWNRPSTRIRRSRLRWPNPQRRLRKPGRLSLALPPRCCASSHLTLSGSPPLRAEARAPPLPALDARQFRDDELDELIRIEDERRRLLALLAEASPEAIVRALRAQLIQAARPAHARWNASRRCCRSRAIQCCCQATRGSIPGALLPRNSLEIP